MSDDVAERAHRYLDYGSTENVNDLISGLLSEITRLANNRDMWKGQCERQAAEIERLRSLSLEGQEPVAWLIQWTKTDGNSDKKLVWHNPDAAAARHEVYLRQSCDWITSVESTPLFASPLLPDGYVMVPREPTAEMHEAAFKQSLAAAEGDVMSSHFVEINTRIYRAMIDAAPPVQMEAVAPADLPLGWLFDPKRNTVECTCGFKFGAEHEDGDGGYSCPNCASPVPSSERDEIIEMCAKVVDEYSQLGTWTASETRQAISSSIRSLKQSPVTGKDT